MTLTIDLNADLGEGSGEAVAESDSALLGIISSASIAGGAHAGNAVLLRQTIRLAKRCGVAVGAHPGFADREHFGRRELRLPLTDVEALVLAQVIATAEVAADEGVRLQHVKVHGALYNMAARDAHLARAVVAAVKVCDRSLLVFGPPGSQLLAAASDAGLEGVAEVFADRAYRADGSLAPRSEPGAVLHDPEVVIARAIELVTAGTVVATDGSRLRLQAGTICVHGDTPGAEVIAARLRRGLEAAGVLVRSAGHRQGNGLGGIQ